MNPLFPHIKPALCSLSVGVISTWVSISSLISLAPWDALRKMKIIKAVKKAMMHRMKISSKISTFSDRKNTVGHAQTGPSVDESSQMPPC